MDAETPKINPAPTRPIAYSEIEVILYLYTLVEGSRAWDELMEPDDAWEAAVPVMRARTAEVRTVWHLPESGSTWPIRDAVESWRFRRSGPPSQDEADRVETLWDAVDRLLGWPESDATHYPLDWLTTALIEMGAGFTPLIQVPAHLPVLTLTEVTTA